MFHTGEEVICIWPGKANGPDCKVNNRFIVRGVAPEHTWNGEKTGRFALVFDCHPYIDQGRNCASAQSYRFQNYQEWLQEESLTTASTCLTPSVQVNQMLERRTAAYRLRDYADNPRKE